MNLATMLEYIEVAPDQLLGVIVAENQPTILWATLAFPQTLRRLDLQSHGRAFSLKATLRDFPVQSQPQ